MVKEMHLDETAPPDQTWLEGPYTIMWKFAMTAVL